MNFSKNKLPSSAREIEWHWRQCVQEKFNLSNISIGEKNLANVSQVLFKSF